MPVQMSVPGRQDAMMRWGAASKHEFDNPAKWHTVTSVPVLDEHEMTDEQGRPVTEVDARVLQEIANNNNKRVHKTGDPAPLIIGHTSDDPRAPEKPVAGFAVNYHVKPFRRDETGRVIYAIHVDYKLRPKFRNAAEDYPRRSVELWWGKKELDPIALLGGTTPERDLGVIIRHARLNAVALLGGTVPNRDLGITVRYDRKGDTVFRYLLDDGPIRYAGGQPKVGKVMSEFKHGSLHSGSKHGPKVTDRDQAIAIAMNEAGLSRDKKSRYAEGDDMAHNCPDPQGTDASLNYADDEAPPTDDLPPDDSDQGFGGDEQGEEDDPMVAKVFQSRQMKELIASIDEIKQAIMGDDMGGGAPPGGGMGAGPPGGAPPMDDGMGGAPPGPPMGAGPPGGGYPPEEEAREFHDAPPVRFESTGFAGPGSVQTPAFGGGNKPYSRNGQNGRKPMQTANAPRQQSANPEVIRMRRQVEMVVRSHQALQLKYARSEAEKIVNHLETVDMIDFSDADGKNADRNKANTAAFLAQLDDQSRDAFVTQTIKKHYRRRQPDPVKYGAEQFQGVAMYARPETGTQPDDPNDFEPQNPREAMEYAELISVKKMSIPDAVKYMRQGRSRRA